eukprot:Em0002g1642a
MQFNHLNQQMIANVVDEADAVLVTKKWWSRSHATKPSLNSVVSAIDDAGFQGQRRTLLALPQSANVIDIIMRTIKMAVQDDADLQQIMKKSNVDPEVLAVRLFENKMIDESILEDVRSRTSVTEKVVTLSDAVTKLGRTAYDDCCALIKNVELELSEAPSTDASAVSSTVAEPGGGTVVSFGQLCGDMSLNLINVAEQNPTYYCPVMKEILFDPYQTTCCGNHISQVAYIKLSKYKSACPMCRNTEFSAYPDKPFQRKIRKLKVRCQYGDFGCRWEGCLNELLAHNEELNAYHVTLKRIRSIAPEEFILTGYEDFKKSWKMWFSPSFYTHPNGYRMCLRVDAEDNGHLSVYAYLMKGVYDDSLPFPFRGTVTVQLINRDKPHQCDIVFDENIDPKHSMRVTEEERQIIGYGNSKFIPLHKLCGYLEHDSLMFRVMVMAESRKGVSIIAEKTIPIKLARSFDWREYGFKLDIPNDVTLLPVHHTEYLTITVSLRGNYTFPDNHDLVSAVYWITPSVCFSGPDHIDLKKCIVIASFEFIFEKDEITVKWPEALPEGFLITPCTKPAKIARQNIVFGSYSSFQFSITWPHVTCVDNVELNIEGIAGDNHCIRVDIPPCKDLSYTTPVNMECPIQETTPNFRVAKFSQQEESSHGASEMVSYSAQKEEIKVYRMESDPHGIALVISNIEFNVALRLSSRKSAKVDEERVKEMFKALKYEVVLLQNLTAAQMIEAFQLVAGSMMFSSLPQETQEFWRNQGYSGTSITKKNDSFICCLMSHGERGEIYGIDGSCFGIELDCFSKLLVCPHLTGKPKMAFIQCCQRGNTAVPILVHSDHPSEEYDFCLSYASIPGSLSYKSVFPNTIEHNKYGGAWYIHALHEAIMTKHIRCLYSLNTEVNRLVAEKQAVGENNAVIKQCSQFQTTLRYHVHF